MGRSAQSRPKDASSVSPAAPKSRLQTRPFTSETVTEPISASPEELQARQERILRTEFKPPKLVFDRPNQPETTTPPWETRSTLPMPHLQQQERDITPIPEQAMAQMRSWSAARSSVHPETQPEPNIQAQSDPIPYSRPAWCDRLTFNPQRPSMVQAKLTVGAPNDQYEQEADAVAAQVMAMPEPTQQPTVQKQTIDPPNEEEEAVQTKPLAYAITPLLQREASPEAEEDEIQAKLLATAAIQREAMPEDEGVQAKPLAQPLDQRIAGTLQRDAMPEDEAVQPKPLGNAVLQREAMPEAEEEELQAKALDGSAIQREAAPEADEEELQTKRLEAAAVQREALPDEEEAVQTKPLGNAVLQRESMPEEEETVQPKRLQRFTDGSLQAGSNLETQLSSSRGGGSPLSDDVRSFMEPRFGADLSQVRVHTGASAVQMNKDLSAQAFTHKQDIFFGAGKSPGKNDLTAHELTHVVQQSGAVRPKVVPSLQKDNKLQTKAAPGQVSDLEAKKLPRENSPPTTADVGHQAQPGVQHGAATTAGSPGAGKPSTKVSPGATGGTGAPSPHKAPGGKAASAAIGGNIAEGTGSQSNKVASGKPRKVLAGGAIGAGSGGTVLGNGGKPIAGGAVIAGGKTAPASPHQDPAFQAVVDKVKNVGQQQKQHDPAPAKAQEAQCAAVAPANEVESKAQANQVGQMEQAETPPFNAAEFKAALMQKIAEAAPKNMEEADDFKKNNKLEPVKGELGGKVKDEKQTTQKPLEEKTKQAPDTSGIAPKPVTPLLPAQSGQAPASVGAEQAVPKPKGQGEVEAPIHADSQKVDQKMAEANVTEEQLAKSNEPSFQSTLKSKQTAQTSAAQIPQEYRQFEQGQLAQAKGEATATAQDKTQGMHVDRAQVMSHVGGHQVETKGKDEQERTKIAGDINQIYQDTKTKVDNALKDLDNQVGEKFDAGANKAKQDFENHVEQKMNAYKEKRYNFSKDPIGGAALWVWDKLAGMPSEVNAFYEEGRNLYLKQMDEVIDQVVTIVGTGLNKAKTEVANGKQKVQAYVSQLPENLKTIGQQAASDIQSKFGELEQTIDSKKDELIDTLAQKYQENLEAVDASIQEKKDANRGLIEKAIDAVVGVIKTIIELGKLLLQVLARVVSVIPQILKDPIGFFNNLASGMKQGFQNFSANIVEHLKKGLISWLTGALAGAGIQLPEKFDLQGIFSLVAQILGFGYEVIRAGLVKRFGEKKVSYMEKTVKVFQVLMAQGIAGLWQFVQEKIGDLKAMVMDNIQNFLIESIVKAGIMWVLSLLNPASAFVRACKAIYDLVTFFMENAERIANFINTLLDSITAIAAGNVAKVANGIESALAQAIPLVLELLAKLLGLGNVSHKVHEIIKKLQKPIKTAIDWVIEKAVKVAKKIRKFAKKIGKKIKTTATSTGKKVKEQINKITEWWKVKQQFKAKDGEIHTLYFKGDDRSSTLMVASKNPKPYTKFLEWVEENETLSEDEKRAIQEAKPIAQSIEQETTKPLGQKLSDVQKEQAREKKKENIEKLLQELQKHTAKLFGSILPKWQKPIFKGLNSAGFGKGMEAEVLTKFEVGNGSEPSQAKHDTYDILNNRRGQGGASYYVRGHLLNQKLGGEGKWENMTPLSREGNGEHEAQFESLVKAAVNSGAIIKYLVTPIYETRSDSTSLKAEVDRRNDPDAGEIKKIIDAEDNVPRALDCSIQRLKNIDNKFEKIGQPRAWHVINQVTRKVEDYLHSGNSKKPTPIKINSGLASELDTLPGITKQEIESICKVVNERKRPFGKYETLAKETGVDSNKLKKWRENGNITL